MNYKRITLLLAGVLAAFVVVTIIHVSGMRNRGGAEVSVDALRDIRWLKETLQLTPGQATEIQRMHEELVTTLATCCGQHCRAQAALMDALFASTNGLDRSQALIDEMSRAQAASEMATLVNIYRVRDVLNPRQREIYERQVKSMSCMMPDGHRGAFCRGKDE